MATSVSRGTRSTDSVSRAVSPKEFCRTLWNQSRGFLDEKTPFRLEDIQLGIILIFYAKQDPSAEEFESQLRTLIADDSPERDALIRTVARRVLRLWCSGKWTWDTAGHLVIRDGRQDQTSIKQLSA